jgi:hypothetical protein
MNVIHAASSLLLKALTISMPANAQSFDQLSNQYKSFDVQCQNKAINCDKRDQVGEQLSQMGGYLCGRRDWFPSPEKARSAGCR